MSKNESLKSALTRECVMYCKPLMMALLLLLLAVLPACSTTVTRLTIPPARCSEFVAAEAWFPIKGVDVSLTEKQREWAASFVGQTARLETANNDKAYIKAVIEACEKREREIYDSLNGKKRRFLGVF